MITFLQMLQSICDTSKSYMAKLISTQFILIIISTKLNLSECQSSAPCLYLYNIKHISNRLAGCVWFITVQNFKRKKMHIHWAQDYNCIWNHLWVPTILLQCIFFYTCTLCTLYSFIFVLSTDMDSFDGFWLVLTVAEVALTLNFP
jgi:hypothetical protein